MKIKQTPKDTPAKGLRLSKARLDELIEEALVDAYGESEQVTGFYTMMENDLRLPFETQVLGMTVSVESIDITEDDQLVAVCRNGKARQRISLSELPLPSPPPEGASGSLRIGTGEPAACDEHEGTETESGQSTQPKRGSAPGCARGDRSCLAGRHG